MEKNIENEDNVDTKNLLIIGNGFDLARKLPTSFSDYIDNYDKDSFQNEKNMFNKSLNVLQNFIKNSSYNTEWTLKNIKNVLKDELPETFNKLSFWDMYILTKRYISENTTTWSDIEFQIYNFFTEHENFNDDHTNFNTLLESHKISVEGPLLNNFKETPVIEVYKDSNLSLQIITYKFIYSLLNNSKDNYYDFLFAQLKKFEQNFSCYLLTTLDYDTQNGTTSSGIEIIESRNKLIDEIFKNVEHPKFNLLDFNYDKFENNNLNKEAHIHGSINPKLRKPIIIGIDSSNINPTNPIYRFTKTYRIMEQSFGNVVKIIDENIKNIFFYGHSLAPADYSYFNAIFDSLDLYNSEVTLTFCYSLYNQNMSEEIKSNQMKSISNLIYKYGTTLQNSHGDNLLHKMLLENRLRLKEIPKLVM